MSIDVFGAINPQPSKLGYRRQRRHDGTMLLSRIQGLHVDSSMTNQALEYAKRVCFRGEVLDVDELTAEERNRIRIVVVIGSPGISNTDFVGGYDVIIQADPPEGHMAGPKALLESLP